MSQWHHDPWHLKSKVTSTDRSGDGQVRWHNPFSLNTYRDTHPSELSHYSAFTVYLLVAVCHNSKLRWSQSRSRASSTELSFNWHSDVLPVSVWTSSARCSTFPRNSSTEDTLPRTTHNSPQCVNKHQRALWVENFLPEPMALFNLIPLPVTTVSRPQTPWQPHLHKSACLPVPFKACLTDCWAGKGCAYVSRVSQRAVRW